MVVNRLPGIEDYWSTDQFMIIKTTQNVMKTNRFQTILQDAHLLITREKISVIKVSKVDPL